MKIAIIGGGAAGLMAAAAASEANPTAEIFLIEKNDELGKKVIISGGGRCNVTTGLRDVRTVLTKYPRGGKFLSSAIYAFTPEAIYEWFEKNGVPLKMEIDSRVFPRSDDGHDIVQVFQNIFQTGNVNVWLRSVADSVTKIETGFSIHFKHENESVFVDRVILTTGGQAYRQTGSTGDGYAFAIELGHTITSLAPSLSSLTSKELWPAEVSGLSFPNARLSLQANGKIQATGPILFTHKGVSGPAVFAFSSLVAYEKLEPKQPLEIAIDIFPELSIEKLRVDLQTAALRNPKKQLENLLANIVPKKFAEVVVRELKLGDKRGNEISKGEFIAIANWFKRVPLQIVGRGVGDEFVTAGGVNLQEVNPKSMESLICPGLFFAGEILDVDGFTGGFNLTASWATGRCAGLHAAI